MHFLLYVCVPVEEAKTSLQARRRACRYLKKEHFIRAGRFCGHCDYFSVGGRCSGMLTLLRLKGLHPSEFRAFLKQYRETKGSRINKLDKRVVIEGARSSSNRHGRLLASG
jgi:predicted transcriptional regulator